MREQVINAEKWYQMTHGRTIQEGEELERDEYRTKCERNSGFSDMRCQKVERYGILETINEHKEKKL